MSSSRTITEIGTTSENDVWRLKRISRLERIPRQYENCLFSKLLNKSRFSCLFAPALSVKKSFDQKLVLSIIYSFKTRDAKEHNYSPTMFWLCFVRPGETLRFEISATEKDLFYLGSGRCSCPSSKYCYFTAGKISFTVSFSFSTNTTKIDWFVFFLLRNLRSADE